MPDFTATIGSFDLAPYVRVEPGAGLDPYDSSGFEEPAFTSSPFSEGEALANVDVRNREMVFPLYLNSASKDALHTLVRNLTRAIRYPSGQLTLTWQDVGASAPTYFDVAYARFDPEFSLRQAAQGWLAGTLRVWVAGGYGHTGTYRVVGTAGAVAGFASYPVPSLGGDAPAELEVVAAASYPRWLDTASGMQNAVLVAVARPAQDLFVGASQVFSNSGSVFAATGAIGSVALGRAGGTSSFTMTARLSLSPSVYSGRNRLLCLYSLSNNIRAGTVSLFETNSLGSYAERRLSDTAMPSSVPSAAWVPLDLGVVTLDPQTSTATRSFRVTIACASGAATSRLFLNGMVVVPEDRSLILREGVDALEADDTAASATYLIRGDLVRRTSVPSGTSQWTRGRDADLSGAISGALPMVNPGGSEAVVVAHFPIIGAIEAYPNQPLTSYVAVRERFTFAR